ncbi:solute carrier family 22 member 7-like [Patella vulgata]|uniref:solute carrier family 22 member 7-like n=1 Tax=Patella vulgata TaxID=6465 RepID=UPI0024A82D65|nr:solute carrier family 22 member 7-like [Patella vulgata]
MPFWAVGVCLLALVAYLIPDWECLHLLCGGFTMPFLLGCFVPESMRWLATKDKIPEALEILARIAKINGTVSLLSIDL